MKYKRIFFVALLLFGIGDANAQSPQAQPSPSLVVDAGRTVSAYRGGNAQSFQIASAIMKETRRILVVLPTSYAQSARATGAILSLWSLMVNTSYQRWRL